MPLPRVPNGGGPELIYSVLAMGNLGRYRAKYDLLGDVMEFAKNLTRGFAKKRGDAPTGNFGM